ncbi:MAG: trypsin-like peptidase domain-containing protein [Nitrososphaeraceae archaeon]|nr:trypsin-like peptidase domain-containing protein [Nitrososphaeraceae archaeon]
MSKVIINRSSSTIVVLMLTLLASGTFFGVANAQNLNGTSNNNKDLSLNDLFELVENSIVQVTKTMPPANPFGPDKENTTSLGSGFIYNNKGYIVTNNHVVENAKVVDVTLINGDRYTANVTGTDAFSDLAVIKINENTTTTTTIPKPLVVGNSSELRVGDQVVAIGNPFGLESSMTTGIVSQIGRLLSIDERGFSIPNAIQTDALINPGNSGGPLLNMKGEVIGVNTAGIFPGGIGLAVPSNTVLRIIPVLMEEKNYTHPWLGVTGNTLTADIAKREKLDRTQKGVIIDTIVRGSPADLAGLNGSNINEYGEKRGGDIITALDGKPIIKMEDLISYLELNKAVNDNATLSVYRDGEIIDKQITLKSRPEAPITNQTQN